MAKPAQNDSAQASNRIPALIEKFEAAGADAMLITALPNIRYLSGFTGSSGLLLVSRKRSTLFTDPRYTLQAAQQVSVEVQIAKGALVTAMGKAVVRRKVKRLAIERNRVPYETVENVRGSVPGCELVALNAAVEELRMSKSPEEIELIRRSVATNSRALEGALKKIRPGMRESEFAAEIDYQQRLEGAEAAAFETIVASGAHSALPHARPSASEIPERGILLIDMGCFENGYASDMTRTMHIGKAPGRFKKMYRAVLEAQRAAIDAVRAGVTAGKVDRAARKVLEQAGLGEEFVHSTGHGLGLEIHEPPRVGKKAETVLQSGFAITIEPGVYLGGYGGIRIEDTVIVTDSGCEVLTPTPKDLIEW